MTTDKILPIRPYVYEELSGLTCVGGEDLNRCQVPACACSKPSESPTAHREPPPVYDPVGQAVSLLNFGIADVCGYYEGILAREGHAAELLRLSGILHSLAQRVLAQAMKQG